MGMGNEVGGNLWRTTGDITDTWKSLREIGFNQVSNQPFAKPGNWNDPDMLVVGWVGWGPSLHPTRLTPDEQYTHIYYGACYRLHCSLVATSSDWMNSLSTF